MQVLIRDTNDPVGIGRSRLWFGLLGGAVAWTMHLMCAYVAAEFGWVSRLSERHYQGISLVAWLVLALTAATVLLAASATAVAYRSQARLRAQVHTADTALEAARYTARAGLIASSIFTLVILFESIPIFFYLRS